MTVPVKSPETSDCAINDGAITVAITSTARIPVSSLFAVISPLKNETLSGGDCLAGTFYLCLSSAISERKTVRKA